LETSEKVNLETGEGDQKKRVGMEDDEIVAVLGHELGHWHEYHSVCLLLFSEVG
jgi:hypothetical protein